MAILRVFNKLSLTMTDYFIIRTPSRYVDTATLFQRVTQGLNESYEDLSNRAFDIIEKAKKQFDGEFTLVDLSYLQRTKQTHILES